MYCEAVARALDADCHSQKGAADGLAFMTTYDVGVAVENLALVRVERRRSVHLLNSIEQGAVARDREWPSLRHQGLLRLTRTNPYEIVCSARRLRPANKRRRGRPLPAKKLGIHTAECLQQATRKQFGCRSGR